MLNNILSFLFPKQRLVIDQDNFAASMNWHTRMSRIAEPHVESEVRGPFPMLLVSDRHGARYVGNGHRVTWTIALVLCLLPASSVSAQEHAPLPEQCRADVHLWYSQSKSQNDALSFNDLQTRASEMWACRSIDTGKGEPFIDFQTDMSKYNTLYTGYVAFSGQRLRDYIQRHGEDKQFLNEDRAGQR